MGKVDYCLPGVVTVGMAFKAVVQNIVSAFWKDSIWTTYFDEFNEVSAMENVC